MAVSTAGEVSTQSVAGRLADVTHLVRETTCDAAEISLLDRGGQDMDVVVRTCSSPDYDTYAAVLRALQQALLPTLPGRTRLLLHFVEARHPSAHA